MDSEENDDLFYRRMLEQFEAGSHDMLRRLRQLEELDSLSERDRAFVQESIAGYENLIRAWDNIRERLRARDAESDANK